MNKSDNIADLAKALVQAQGKIGAAVKGASNPFFKSHYADLGAVIEAVKGPLLEHGITYLQGVHDAEGGVAVETVLLHESGQWISSTLRIPASKQDAQGFGSAISYGRRYGLQALCGVPGKDDDGNAATATAHTKQFQSVAKDDWDSLSPDTQKWLQGIADTVRNAGEIDGWLQAMKKLEEYDLEATHKVAIWSRFSSKERAAMEPHKRQKRAA